MTKHERPSPPLTLTVEVPDFHSLAARFHAAGAAPLTIAEAHALHGLRIQVPADAVPEAVELAVKFRVAEVLRSRLIVAHLLTAGYGDVLMVDPKSRGLVLVAEFTPADTSAVAA